MHSHEVPVVKMMEFYNSPDLQSKVVHYIGHLRNYDKTKDDEYLYKASDIAEYVYGICPFDEVVFEGNLSNEPNDIMILICLHLSELKVIPNYET
jgi:hypothetical protein